MFLTEELYFKASGQGFGVFRCKVSTCVERQDCQCFALSHEHLMTVGASGGGSPQQEPTRPACPPQDPTFKPCQMKTHFLLPFPVNYVGECIRTAPYADPDHARYGARGGQGLPGKGTGEQGWLVGTQGPDMQGCFWVQGKGRFHEGNRLTGWCSAVWSVCYHVPGKQTWVLYAELCRLQIRILLNRFKAWRGYKQDPG